MPHRWARWLAALLFLSSSVAAKTPDRPMAIVASAASAPGVIVMGGEFIGGLKLGEQSFASRGRGGFIAARARDGRILWARVFATERLAAVNSVAIRANGESAIGGGVGPAPVDFGGGITVPQGRSNDGFVVRYDARGEHVWSRRVAPADGRAGVSAVVYAPDGDLLVAGCFGGARFALGDDALVNAYFPRAEPSRLSINSVPRREDRQFSDGFVARFRGSDGKTLWSRRLGAEASDCVDTLAVDASGDAYLSMKMFGAAVGEPVALATPGWKRAIVKLDGATGGVRWSQVLSAVGSTDVDGRTLLADAGILYLAGNYDGTFKAGSVQVEIARGGYVVAMDARDGKFVWVRSLRAQYGVFETRLALGPAGSLLVSTVVVGPAQFAAGVKVELSNNIYSAVLLGLSRQNGGEALWARELGARAAARPMVGAIGRWDTGETWWAGNVKDKLVVRTLAASP